MHLKISSAKWRPCCLGLNVLDINSCLQCSPPCGEGQQFRAVYCVSPDGLYQPEAHCPQQNRPEEFRMCSLGPCPEAMWVMGEWGEVRARQH